MIGISILPQDKLDIIKGNKMHMSLAHLLGKDGYENYTEFYTEEIRNGSYVIMDNGVIEGDQQNLETLCDKALKFGVSEMILPDVFLDSTATVDSTVEAFNEIMCNPKYTQVADNVNLMIVPQGKTIGEYLWCLETILTHIGTCPYCIGIPKVLTKLCGRDARLEVIKRLPEVLPKHYKPHIHLLGCHQSILEAKRIAKMAETIDYCNVRSIDSALPFVYARVGLPMNACDRPDSEPIGFKSSPDVCGVFLKTQVNFWEAECSGDYLKPVDKIINVNF